MNPVQFQMMAYPPSDGALERFLNVQFETAVCHTTPLSIFLSRNFQVLLETFLVFFGCDHNGWLSDPLLLFLFGIVST
jgi:hypothetical protein